MKKKMTMTSGSRASKKDEDAYKSYAKKVDEQEKEQPVPYTRERVREPRPDEVAIANRAREKKTPKYCPKCNVTLTTTEKLDYMRCQQCGWLYDKGQWKESKAED